MRGRVYRHTTSLSIMYFEQRLYEQKAPGQYILPRLGIYYGFCCQLANKFTCICGRAWRELYHALENATCAVFRHCSRREMASPNGIRLLKFLDGYIYDCFYDNDSDRDSDKELDGVDRVSDVDS